MGSSSLDSFIRGAHSSGIAARTHHPAMTLEEVIAAQENEGALSVKVSESKGTSKVVARFEDFTRTIEVTTDGVFVNTKYRKRNKQRNNN